MAKVTAPNLSMKSSGQVGKTLVNASWKGRDYVRSYATPSNPRTTNQMKTRNSFSWLSDAWKTLNAAVQAVWTAYAKGQVMTDRNAWISKNNAALRTATDLSGMIVSPGTASGVVAAGIEVTGSAGSLSVALTAPTLPTGWTITKAHAVAIKQQVPTSDTTDPTSYYASDDTSPYAPAITVPAGTYQVFGFFEFQRDDGKTAFGMSITGTGTAT